MEVKFLDLQKQNKILMPELVPLLKKVIYDADFTMGSSLEKFEKDFAKYVGKKYAVGLNSGTDALMLSLLAYGLKPGDEVIVPANSYFSTAMVVSNIGAIPVFVDIDESYHLIDYSRIEKRITKKTRAIIPVHLYGQSVDMRQILRIAKKYKLIIVEDACQAHGAMYNGRKVPISETGAFSFYPGKNLGAFGDGGIVVTDNKSIKNKILLLRNDGSIKKYVHDEIGFKSRLDDIQAVVLNYKLKKLDEWNKLRNDHAAIYTKLLCDVKEIKLPVIRSNTFHVFHLFVIECEKRDELQKYLKSKGITVIIHYPIPIHLQKPYKKLGYTVGDFPVAEDKSKKILSLPMFPEITVKEISYIVRAIKSFYYNAK